MVKCSASQPVVLRRQEGRRQEPGGGESGGQPSFGVTGASGARTDLGILWYCTLKKSQVRIACIPWGDGGRQGRSRRAPTQVVKVLVRRVTPQNLTDGAASEGGSFEFEQLSSSSCVWPYVYQLREHIQRAYVHQLPLFGCWTLLCNGHLKSQTHKNTTKRKPDCPTLLAENLYPPSPFFFSSKFFLKN